VGVAARFYFPFGCDTDGTFVYVSDTNNRAVRRVRIADGEWAVRAGRRTARLWPGQSSVGPTPRPTLGGQATPRPWPAGSPGGWTGRPRSPSSATLPTSPCGVLHISWLRITCALMRAGAVPWMWACWGDVAAD
jgi:hypothetical protein